MALKLDLIKIETVRNCHLKTIDQVLTFPLALDLILIIMNGNNPHVNMNAMRKFFDKSIIAVAILLVSCESIDESFYSTDHHVVTIDRSQVTSLNCVYLYNTEKKESGWNNSSATANALRVLKDQAHVAGGNAIVIRDIYSSKEYRDGYRLDAA